MKALAMALGLIFFLLGASLGSITTYAWSVLTYKERLMLIFLSLVSVALSGVCFYPIFFNVN
jgi:hypothetical protein